MKEYYAVDGSMSELFLEAESDWIVSGSNNRREEIVEKYIYPKLRLSSANVQAALCLQWSHIMQA